MTLDEMQAYSLGVSLLQLLLFWLFCAFLAAGFGNTKGEGVMGFLLGILLGPFGVLAAYFSRGNRAPCPHCQELRYKAATVCPHCQRTPTAEP